MDLPTGVVRLHHGTTLRRAERIIRLGPDRRYVEPGGTYYIPAEGLSTFPAGFKPLDSPDAEEYARRKANNFPNEGGAVILEIEVPDWLVDYFRNHPDGRYYIADSGEIRFELGMGLEQLLQEWPNLTKRIIPL
jgi:hypothetical protein